VCGHVGGDLGSHSAVRHPYVSVLLHSGKRRGPFRDVIIRGRVGSAAAAFLASSERNLDRFTVFSAIAFRLYQR